ncbi:MAG: TadE/TadG family type IV pilus assembly protein [Acidobacteriota bacterium]|nr:TadE/TadG family type IV pilus assembly protein [Acidobacteriota bacterium]
MESTQLAVLLPLLLLSLFAVVQAGIWLAGRSTVQQAAMAAAEQAAFADANPANAKRVAAEFAARGGLTGVSVELTTTDTSINVRVAAQVSSLLPGQWSHVTASAHRMAEA